MDLDKTRSEGIDSHFERYKDEPVSNNDKLLSENSDGNERVE